MPKVKLADPRIKVDIARRLAGGESQGSIARGYGICQQRVSAISQEDEVKELIKQERLRLLDIAPDAIQNVTDLIKEMPAIPKADARQRELAYKATQDVLKAVGIFPNPQVNILAVHQSGSEKESVIEPRVFDIIQRVTASMLELPKEEQ